ncbi:Sin3 histone deacetylase corepressor complex component SDS3 [Linnemannia hyalina]|uniref:Sin3 histone deacetylase corepressor complex component SDS3 n=1 Tax=Linnemannia hyalina TaxID=64524 RepID=A0A9P7XHR8_9FUNG|nr:Sin3 histone deacetylase corepressor complex component SDS3 [Linnemannia hyalina]
MPPTQKSASSASESRHHGNSSGSTMKKSSAARSQRPSTHGNSKAARSQSKQPSSSSATFASVVASTVTVAGGALTSSGAAAGGDAHSESEDSYIAGGGFLSEMDEHDSAFDGAMEYDEEDGRSLLGDDFDASSDAPEVRESTVEKRRREFQERLIKLELEFEENKQTIYNYQMARYKEEMDAILNGAHPDFHDQLEDLADARNVAIANARLYRDYQFECAQGAYELETEMAEEEYMNEREGLREKMLAVIDSKRRALRDDKENLDITNDFALEPTSRAHQTRKLRKRGADNDVGAKNSKKKASQPPAAKWLAVDADALDDLGLMRRAVSTGFTTKKTTAVKKK